MLKRRVAGKGGVGTAEQVWPPPGPPLWLLSAQLQHRMLSLLIPELSGVSAAEFGAFFPVELIRRVKVFPYWPGQRGRDLAAAGPG